MSDKQTPGELLARLRELFPDGNLPGEWANPIWEAWQKTHKDAGTRIAELELVLRGRIERVTKLEAKVKRWRDAAREVIKNSSHEDVRHECFAREVKLSMLARYLAAEDNA